MVAAAKAAVPTVGDQSSALQLGNFAKATASALAELRAASSKVRERDRKRGRTEREEERESKNNPCI